MLTRTCRFGFTGFPILDGMTTTFAIEQPQTGLFEFSCLAVFKVFGPFALFSDAEYALAEHAQMCDECAFTGAFVEPQRVPTPSVVVPKSVAQLILSDEEMYRNMYKTSSPWVEASDLLGRALIAEAMLPVAEADIFMEKIRTVAKLASDALRAGRGITWE